MFCKKCAAEIKEGSTFCDKCGERVGTTNRKTKKEFIYIAGALLAIIVVIFIYTSSKEKKEMLLARQNTPKGVVEKMMKGIYEDNFKLYKSCFSEDFIYDVVDEEDLTYDEVVEKLKLSTRAHYYWLKFQGYEYSNIRVKQPKGYRDKDDYDTVWVEFDFIDKDYSKNRLPVHRDSDGKWYLKYPLRY